MATKMMATMNHSSEQEKGALDDDVVDNENNDDGKNEIDQNCSQSKNKGIG